MVAVVLRHVLSSQSVVTQAEHTERKESETYDIYLLPPNEDPETCQSWLRMRNRDGRYTLMFEEWVCDGPFIISPRITFEVCSQLFDLCFRRDWPIVHGIPQWVPA